MREEFIVNFSPTWMLPTREQSPYVPLTPGEIVDDVLAAAEIGITMAHLHVRDPLTGEPDYHAELFAEVMGPIRRYAPELILCVSLSGRNFNTFETRSAPLSLDGMLKPDMGSLTLSSLNFNRTASINTPEMIRMLTETMNDRQIKPELEAFDVGMVHYAHYLLKKDWLRPPCYFNLILGNIACAQPNLLHPGMMLSELPDDAIWSLGGIGGCQFRMNLTGILNGGGVRTGLEDNLYLDAERRKPASNLDLLKRIKRAGTMCGKKIMPPARLRARLGLEPGNGRYGVKTSQ